MSEIQSVTVRRDTNNVELRHDGDNAPMALWVYGPGGLGGTCRTESEARERLRRILRFYDLDEVPGTTGCCFGSGGEFKSATWTRTVKPEQEPEPELSARKAELLAASKWMLAASLCLNGFCERLAVTIVAYEREKTNE